MTSSPCWLAAAIVASLSCYAPAEQSVAISGSARIIDGDTPEIGTITIRTKESAWCRRSPAQDPEGVDADFGAHRVSDHRQRPISTFSTARPRVRR